MCLAYTTFQNQFNTKEAEEEQIVKTNYNNFS